MVYVGFPPAREAGSWQPGVVPIDRNPADRNPVDRKQSTGTLSPTGPTSTRTVATGRACARIRRRVVRRGGIRRHSIADRASSGPDPHTICAPTRPPVRLRAPGLRVLPARRSPGSPEWIPWNRCRRPGDALIVMMAWWNPRTGSRIMGRFRLQRPVRWSGWCVLRSALGPLAPIGTQRARTARTLIEYSRPGLRRSGFAAGFSSVRGSSRRSAVAYDLTPGEPDPPVAGCSTSTRPLQGRGRGAGGVIPPLAPLLPGRRAEGHARADGAETACGPPALQVADRRARDPRGWWTPPAPAAGTDHPRRARGITYPTGEREREEWNGMEWNGMEWNGMEWNGMERTNTKGMEWNGME